MRVILVASEVVGFAKTGGLADVAGSLPRALAARGHDVAVVMPYYQAVRLGATRSTTLGEPFSVPLGNRSVGCQLHRATLPDSNVPIIFIDAPEYFNRDDAKSGLGLYQQLMPGGYRADYPDNAERFVFFCRAVLESIPRFGPMPDIIHANDWQTGLLASDARGVVPWSSGLGKGSSLCLRFTTSRIRGCSAAMLLSSDGPAELVASIIVSWNTTAILNCLKAGIVFADAVSTVSPTYAQ